MTPNMIGQQLGSFLIKSQLGAGAMGVVYRAIHTKSGKPAAVKVITSEQATRGNAAERFEREAEILKNLKHPNIVRWLGVGRFRGTDYFAMEFIEGRTLEDILGEKLQKHQEPLSWREVVDLGLQVCEALHYAHERNVVHRDLKPSNIMVASGNHVKLTDFGIAKLLDADATKLTATGRTLGTAAYMAPEQIRGTPEVSHKTDLYAMGCLLYQMLTGQTPFQGTQLAVLMNCHLTQDPPRPSGKSADLPLDLDRLIVELMAKEPRDRPRDAAAVAERLRGIQAKIQQGAPIRMVFGGEVQTQESALMSGTPSPPSASLELPEPASTGAVATATPTRVRGAAKSKKKKAGSGWSVPSPGTIGLVAALIGLVILIGYMLQPLTAEQLYARARPLMESKEPADWKDAERMYLDELEQRFPDHPYQQEVQKLRDKIALNDTRARARRITKGLIEAKTEVESLYKRTAMVASEAEKTGNSDVAMRTWSDLARVLHDEFPKEHGWMLLAQDNAKDLRDTIELRSKETSALIRQISIANQNGQDELAQGLRQRLAEQCEKYPYLIRMIPGNLLPAGTQSEPTIDGPATPEPLPIDKAEIESGP